MRYAGRVSSATRPRLSVDDYLRLERAAAQRSEYLSGDTFLMAGASREHNLVVLNVAAELRARLRGSPCEVYPSDMRVSTPSGLFTYPDVSVACSPTFRTPGTDTLLNPVLLVEVLSPTTEAFDRGRKFEHYRSLDALREYLLVSTAEARIERFRRTETGWLFDEAAGLDAAMALSSVPAELPLAEVFARVTLGPAPPALR